MYSSNSDTRLDRFTRHKVPKFRDGESDTRKVLGTYRPKKKRSEHRTETNDDD